MMSLKEIEEQDHIKDCDFNDNGALILCLCVECSTISRQGLYY